MHYRIDEHARERMQRRGITEEMVDAVMQTPDQVIPEKKGRKAYQSKMTIQGINMLLRLIVVETRTQGIVVTVYPTTDIDRYWRP